MNMLIDFKKFHIKILVHMKKTYDVTIDHMVHFVGSKLGLYVSFLIPLYVVSTFLVTHLAFCQIKWKQINTLSTQKSAYQGQVPYDTKKS